MTLPADLHQPHGHLRVLRETRRYGRLYLVCLCELCGLDTEISAYHLDARKNRACRKCTAKIRAKPRGPDTCSVCGALDHNRSACEQRPRSKSPWCGECAGLPHRARAPKCRTCGTRYAPETNERPLELRIGQWSWIT